MSDDIADVVVVGARPAGATAALAARAARPDACVVLLDRVAFPRDKPCGDGLAPEALDIWTALGVHGLTAGFPPLSRLRLVGTDGSTASGTMRRPAWVVPREVLDARLVRAAVDSGVELRQHRVRRVERVPGGVVVDGSIRARTLVAADGPGSVVRRTLGIPSPQARHVAVAVRGYADLPQHLLDRPPEQLLRLDAVGWPAYAWCFPIGDGTANVGYGVVLGGRTQPTRSQLVAGLRRGLPWLGQVRGLRGHLLPLASAPVRAPDGPVLLAGDAASLVNPVSGEGIVYAALSGRHAGAAAVSAAVAEARGGVDPGRTYRRAMARALGPHHAAVRGLALAGRRASLVDAAVRAADRRTSVFHDLVALALADGVLTPRVVAGTLAAWPAASSAGSSTGLRGSTSVGSSRGVH